MPAYYALALSVGLLAVLDTWLFVSPLAALLPGLVWVSFIAWGAISIREVASEALRQQLLA